MEDPSKACALTQLKQAVTDPVLYEKGVRAYHLTLHIVCCCASDCLPVVLLQCCAMGLHLCESGIRTKLHNLLEQHFLSVLLLLCSWA